VNDFAKPSLMDCKHNLRPFSRLSSRLTIFLRLAAKLLNQGKLPPKGGADRRKDNCLLATTLVVASPCRRGRELGVPSNPDSRFERRGPGALPMAPRIPLGAEGGLYSEKVMVRLESLP